MAGTGAPALGDVRQLVTPETIGLPVRIEDTKQSLENFLILLHVLLGQNHITTCYIQQQYHELVVNYAALDNKVTIDGQHQLPSHILCFVQIVFVYWVAAQERTNAQEDLPSRQAIVRQAAMGMTNWVVPLPEAYLQLPLPPTLPVPQPAPAAPPAAAPAPAPTAPPAGNWGQMVRNENWDRTRFEVFKQ
jgi:hypothetical protein